MRNCNQMNHFYVDIPAPSLHGNNSEIGAKTVNIKMIHPVMIDVKSCEENSMLRMGLLSQKIIQNCQKSNPSHLLLKSLVNQL